MANPATTRFVDIADIKDTIVLMKDGSLRSLLEVQSVNFDLKSNDEQVAILRGFQDFLNAVDFPLQIVVRSRKLDIGPYLEFIATATASLTNELLKIQAEEYSRFIKGLTELASIMKKNFYISIPFHGSEVRAKGGIGQQLKSLFGFSSPAQQITPEDLEHYKTQISQRISVINSGLGPLGIKITELGQDQLIALFTSSYGN